MAKGSSHSTILSNNPNQLQLVKLIRQLTKKITIIEQRFESQHGNQHQALVNHPPRTINRLPQRAIPQPHLPEDIVDTLPNRDPRPIDGRHKVFIPCLIILNRTLEDDYKLERKDISCSSLSSPMVVSVSGMNSMEKKEDSFISCNKMDGKGWKCKKEAK
ncbi:hypothetical protein NE237_008297 [Protea cynaroides]|uniref:Uncharacterized protein n=1 Tax=Protea cynaroides TaxID=273540 RepID=A0A9Q0GKN8_9MAGN|nr:hypothetical protein NE237_008297 [Protea cynaroides]